MKQRDFNKEWDAVVAMTRGPRGSLMNLRRFIRSIELSIKAGRDWHRLIRNYKKKNDSS